MQRVLVRTALLRQIMKMFQPESAMHKQASWLRLQAASYNMQEFATEYAEALQRFCKMFASKKGVRF